MLRLALVAVVALVLAPSANAWSWPCEGSVLRPFSLVDDPYAAGQHRGIDVGCGAGAGVGAPASGTVTFAGSLPGMGRGVTIQTADGYAVTLVQLRATTVSRGDAVDEGATVGAVGESEDPVTRAPHVHLGVRVSSDANGYLDPLSLLPRRPAVPPPASAAPPPPVAVAQPVSKPQMPAAPVAPAAPPAVQPPVAAAPAQPTVTPIAAESPRPAAAVSAATTSAAEPEQVAEPVAVCGARGRARIDDRGRGLGAPSRGDGTGYRASRRDGVGIRRRRVGRQDRRRGAWRDRADASSPRSRRRTGRVISRKGSRSHGLGARAPWRRRCGPAATRLALEMLRRSASSQASRANRCCVPTPRACTADSPGGGSSRPLRPPRERSRSERLVS